jgi:hypothetical protein
MKFLIVSDSQIKEVGHVTKWSIYVRHLFFGATVVNFHVPAQVKAWIIVHSTNSVLPRFIVSNSEDFEEENPSIAHCIMDNLLTLYTIQCCICTCSFHELTD